MIGDDGTQYGVVSMIEAQRIAEDKGLDLVEVSPTAKPPVVKIIDYGKFKYIQQKKANEAKKKTATVQLKEIQLRPNIEAADLETKLKRAYKFLDQGDKIKMVLQFRGREMAYRDNGMKKFNSIIERVQEHGAIVESEPKMMGTRIIAILASNKKPVKKGGSKPSSEKERESKKADSDVNA